MALTVTTTYAGREMETFLTLASYYNPTVEMGGIAVHNQIPDKKPLPRLQMANIMQDHSANPTSAGSITIDQKELNPQPFLAFQRFNPRELESMFTFANSTQGDPVNREIPANVRVAFVGEVMKLVSEFMETAIWQATANATSAAGATYQNKFDGLIPQAVASGTVLKPASPVALTAANIVEKVKETWALLSSALKRDPNLKIFMSVASGELWQDAVEGQSNKGNDFTTRAPMQFRSIPIMDVPGMPDDTIFITRANINPLQSNIHLGIDWQYGTSDPVIKIERWRPESEEFFFKFLMQADTKIGFDQESALYSV